ncbi:MAG: hypothetical protein O9262_14180 [Cyclobacteriaceae bacterium]|nr:hypothetical protein [Cyclobacteriaceae bacterium]
MENNKIQDILKTMKDNGGHSYFSLKKNDQQENHDIFIDANRNGILAFCEILLQSLERSDLKNEFLKDMPDNFQAVDSDVWITHIKVANGNRTPIVESADSFLLKLGCIAGLIAIVAIFLTGLVNSIGWIVELIK